MRPTIAVVGRVVLTCLSLPRCVPRVAPIALIEGLTPAELQFKEWLRDSAPPSASPANCNIVTSDATSVAGVLRDVWQLVERGLRPQSASDSSPTVLLLPRAEWASKWARFAGLDKHLRTCRDCCQYFGQVLRVQALHPDLEAETPEGEQEASRRRAPLPALTLSRRLGPMRMRPEVDLEPFEEATEAGPFGSDIDSPPLLDADAPMLVLDVAANSDELESARESLERRFRAMALDPSALAVEPAVNVPVVPPERALDEALEWFAMHFGRVHRVLAARQRRVVVPSADAERVYAAFWAEVALLFLQSAVVGDASEVALLSREPGAVVGAASAPAEAREPAEEPEGTATSFEAADSPAVVMQQPVDPVASLLVLPGLAEPTAFRNVYRSLTLSLLLLGLADDFTLSGFHPRDTFQEVTAEDGSTSWEMQLRHPLIHIVRKR